MGIVTSFFDGTIRTVDDPKPKKKITLLVSWDMFFWRKGRVGTRIFRIWYAAVNIVTTIVTMYCVYSRFDGGAMLNSGRSIGHHLKSNDAELRSAVLGFEYRFHLRNVAEPLNDDRLPIEKRATEEDNKVGQKL